MTPPTEFEQWWKLYPKKLDKGHARKAFAAARKKADFETLCAAVRRFPFSPEKQFIPYPATWLNGERWMEVAEAAAEAQEAPEDVPALHVPGAAEGLVRGWEAAQRALAQMNPSVFRSWMRDLVLVGEIEGMPALRARSKWRADWIVNHYGYELRTAWRKPVVVLAEGA